MAADGRVGNAARVRCRSFMCVARTRGKPARSGTISALPAHRRATGDTPAHELAGGNNTARGAHAAVAAGQGLSCWRIRWRWVSTRRGSDGVPSAPVACAIAVSGGVHGMDRSLPATSSGPTESSSADFRQRPRTQGLRTAAISVGPDSKPRIHAAQMISRGGRGLQGVPRTPAAAISTSSTDSRRQLRSRFALVFGRR